MVTVSTSIRRSFLRMLRNRFQAYTNDLIRDCLDRFAVA